MKTQTHSSTKAHVLRNACYLALFLLARAIPFAGAQESSSVTGKASHPAVARLTFADRVSYQWAIENIYWRHRIWPDTNPGPKPSLEAMVSEAELEKKVTDYLRNSQALEDYWQRPITGDQLQAEMERMASDTKQPEVLRELFEALGNDPFVIAECLARPILAERFANGDAVAAGVPPAHPTRMPPQPTPLATANYHLPLIASPSGGCIDDTWTPTTLTNAPAGRYEFAGVWTGTEMIVWGGETGPGTFFNTGGRYNPSTDSWTATSTTNAPSARRFHTAIWTGTEMIVWGGYNGSFFNTGGRYNPITDSWTATSTTNGPAGRSRHGAVWTGSQMIVWGGRDATGLGLNTGGRYDPNTDSWTATNTNNGPVGRWNPTAIWTGSEMIVWGGHVGDVNSTYFNTGGRYNPVTDNWIPTTLTNAPSARTGQSSVWTGSEMIVWGGYDGSVYLNTGGRYDPGTDTWTATSTTNAPAGRSDHTAVWTNSEMIVWGGSNGSSLNTGGRYTPSTDSWTATSMTNAPAARYEHTAVWTDSEMVVWGGREVGFTGINTGGKYCATAPENITLSARKKKVNGINTARITWDGATSTDIDVYRNGTVIITTPNDGSYIDSTGDTGRARYTYQVCEAGTQTCSNEVTVSFQQ